MARIRKTRNEPADVCFVLDATISTRSIFAGMIDEVNEYAFDLKKDNRRAYFHYGAVIYRDPVDYRPLPADKEAELAELEAKLNQERKERLKASDLYDEELEAEREEMAKHFDHEKYPINKNVPIPFKEDIEQLIEEIMKVESDGGNDKPEDWVGALSCALNDLDWHDGSKKWIVWISDANAHGKRFCGYDNHNEEEEKLVDIIKTLARENFYFIGINVIKKDDGCKKTLQELKKIYEENGGKSFVYEEFKPTFNDKIGSYNDDYWTANVLNDFQNTLNKTISNTGIFSDF